MNNNNINSPFLNDSDAPLCGVEYTIENPNVTSENVTRFLQIDRLEKQVQTLDQRVSTLYEMIERLIEVNLLLKRSSSSVDPQTPSPVVLPMYNPQTTENGNSNSSVVQILKSNGTIFIKGKTFDIKDQLKSEFGAKWDSSLKMWGVNDEAGVEEKIREFLTRNGFSI